ncbi:PEP/pyruvate-binding domain-containing protein [Bradyrhizobium sp. SZCCHNR2009]|nr:PEP/pyruvate-binding domain-containing protein [Bradyrhizobium sp. SZCCHNR2009]
MGGKGANLRKMTERGLPVPRWLSVGSQHFDRLKEPLRDEIAALAVGQFAERSQEFEVLSQRLRAGILAAELDRTLEVQIAEFIKDGSSTYAIRSSANQEDSNALSFAGLFDSYLNVPPTEIADHIKKCWLSAFNPSALRYLQQHGLSLASLRMAVVVQEMICAQKSGVMFQANPQGRLDEVVIVAGYGLGEGIVSNRVGVDTIYHDRSSKKTRSVIGQKADRLDCAPSQVGGVALVAVDEASATAPALSEHQISSLLELSERLSAIYDEYQDVEWAIDSDERIWVLQSRPITTIPAGQLQLYDDANVSENFPGVSSPLTISIVQHIYEKMFYNAMLHCGYSDRVLKAASSVFKALVEPIEGRIYYNMTSWRKMLGMLPFGSSLFLPALEDSIGARRSQTKGRVSGLRLSKVRALCLFILKYCLYNRELARYRLRYDRLQQATHKKLEVCAEPAELVEILTEFLDRVLTIDHFGRISDSYLMITLLLLRTFVRKRGLDDEAASSLINGLLVGERDLESVKPVRSLRALARYVSERPDLHEAVAKAAHWETLKRQLRSSAPVFLEMCLTHIDLYGDRTLAELKLETVTFREAPLRLMALVDECARSGARQEEADARECDIRQSAEDRLLSLFSSRMDRLLIQFLVSNLRRFIRSRELVRLNRARYHGLIRSIVLKLADAWTRVGALKKREDIFCLTATEIIDAVKSSALPSSELISSRQLRSAELERRHPIHRLWLKGDIETNIIPQILDHDDHFEQAEISEQARILKGTGCCPGRVEGEALVLKSPRYDADARGKILVAESTDPGWVFLIMSASGLIMEKGSLLSHTAIIGREMGIPTIVGVREATSQIRSSSTISMDGNSGEIVLRAS